MFYSQFILAKKGPLGTIWIAAHLERKLRKNQVADTDIGVSVGKDLFFFLLNTVYLKLSCSISRFACCLVWIERICFFKLLQDLK